MGHSSAFYWPQPSPPERPQLSSGLEASPHIFRIGGSSSDEGSYLNPLTDHRLPSPLASSAIGPHGDLWLEDEAGQGWDKESLGHILPREVIGAALLLPTLEDSQCQVLALPPDS